MDDATIRAPSIRADGSFSGPLRSKRLLALARDERLVEQIRRGNEAAFEVAFERYAGSILAFCRHMLGSRDEAEDAVQHTFAAAFRDLQRGGDRPIALKPWLFAIARNRCVSLLRSRRDQPMEEPVLATAGLAEQVEQRAELRRLLDDVRELPEDQRAALLLTEVGDLSHAEAAGVLGCGMPKVKALVYRARSGLIARREARAKPCDEIREQLANLRGGSLRRTELRLHLRECPGCRAYRAEVKRQRALLGAALPVAPTLGLKSSVLAAAGLGGASAGGGAAAGLAGTFGGAGVAKLATVAVIAGAGVVGGQAVVESGSAPAPPSGAASGAGVDGGGAGGGGGAGVGIAGATPRLPATAPERPGRGVGRFMGRDDTKKRPTPSGAPPPGRAKPAPGRGNGRSRGAAPGERLPGRGQARGRGPVGAPPAQVPVRRRAAGPPPAKAPRAPVQQGPPKSSKPQGAQPPGQAQPRPAEPVAKAKPPKPNPGAPKAKPR